MVPRAAIGGTPECASHSVHLMGAQQSIGADPSGGCGGQVGTLRSSDRRELGRPLSKHSYPRKSNTKKQKCRRLWYNDGFKELIDLPRDVAATAESETVNEHVTSGVERGRVGRYEQPLSCCARRKGQVLENQVEADSITRGSATHGNGIVATSVRHKSDIGREAREPRHRQGANPTG